MVASAELSSYIKGCEQAANGYIEQSTRFGAIDLHCLNAEAQSYSFSIYIRHQLFVVSEESSCKGRSNPRAEDYITDSSDEYARIVAHLKNEEESCQATIDGLVSQLISSPYASISKTHLVRVHPSRVHYTYACTKCMGRGQNRCSNCSGNGNMKCYACHSSGKMICTSCNGHGSRRYEVSKVDYGGTALSTKYEDRMCTDCSGVGYFSCYTCCGRGTVTCSSCGGTGSITCDACAGTGALTRIAEIHTYTEPTFSGYYPNGLPKFVGESVLRIGFENVAQHGAICYMGEQRSYSPSQATLIYRADMDFCLLDLEIKQFRSHWVIFGSQYTIHDAGGILEKLVQEDFDSLVAFRASKACCLPWYAWGARRAVHPFIESEVHQHILDANGDGYDPDAIHERLSRSLSINYITNTLGCLGSMVRVLDAWAIPFGFLFTMLLAVLIRIALVLWKGRILFLYSTLHKGRIYAGYTSSSFETLLCGVGVALFGWYATRWIVKCGLFLMGGLTFERWARRKKLLPGFRTALVFQVLTIVATLTVCTQLPVWFDLQGKLYGLVFVSIAPVIR